MVKSVSLAKISRPRIHGVVPRERLFALLDGLCERSLVWLSAPPGAGKTALIGSYLEARQRPVIWYQVDSADADPAAFFQYMARAGADHLRSDVLSLPRMIAEHLRDLVGFARLFFRALFEALPADLVLVLDNYQELPEDSPVQGVVRQCIAELPLGCTVVAISRIDAPKSFVALRASGQMLGMDWETVRFSLDELRALCRERRVTDEWLLQALHQQSHGWAAGITLLLERLGHFDGQSRELPAHSREAVFDYFASLVIEQTQDVEREILLSLAYLPNATPSLATTVSGRTQAPALLEDLYLRRLFTDRRQGVEPVYQFHALFLEFLKLRARETMSVETHHALMKRSALALEESGECEAALRLRLQSKCWTQATRLLLELAPGYPDSGRGETLLTWIEALPDSVRDEQPWVRYWQGCAQVQSDTPWGYARWKKVSTCFAKTISTLDASSAWPPCSRPHSSDLARSMPWTSGSMQSSPSPNRLPRWHRPTLRTQLGGMAKWLSAIHARPGH